MTTALAGVTADVKAKFDTLTQGQKDVVAAYTKQGIDINKAINDAAKLNTEQITNVKTQLTTLTGDVKIKFDALTKSQQDIVTSQVQLGVDVNKAIDDAAKTTSEQITNVRTDLTKDITNVQTQFNARVDELVLQGKTYQEATQEALKELGSGVSGCRPTSLILKNSKTLKQKPRRLPKTRQRLKAASALQCL
jgi:DNA-directed RNA polymerase subunit L